jgi:DNA ligase-1
MEPCQSIATPSLEASNSVERVAPVGEHAGGALSLKNPWPTNPDGTPKGKGWPAGLAPGECKEVRGSRGDVYILKHHVDGGGLSCTCPSWQMQPGVHPKLPGMARTCKHWDAEAGALVMKRHIARGLEALGEDYVPRAERADVIEARDKKRARCEATGVLYKPFSRQRVSSSADGVPMEPGERLQPPADGGFFGAESFALAWDLTGQPVEGMWMSEKLDGVRAYYDGNGRFWSRNGKQFKAPPEVAAQVPFGTPLDGELWMGRGTFQQMNGFLKRKDALADEWRSRKVRFMVFDAPFVEGNYEARMKHVRDIVGYNEFVKPVPIERVVDEASMRERSRKIAEEGGEGIMLREPHGIYRPDRTCDLLKVVDRLHAEALVVGYNQGTGRLASAPAASLRCRLRSGNTFSVGSGMVEVERYDPPPIGSIVVVQYKGMTDDGKPRQPTYKGRCQRVDVDASQFATALPEDADTEWDEEANGPAPPTREQLVAGA